MSVLNPNGALFKGLYGARVSKAATAITAISTKPLFTVAGGRVVITSLIGEVTTAIQAQANAAKIVFNPDATGADTDLTATEDINADAVGTLYGVSGDFSDALLVGLLALEAPAFGGPFILSEGSIGLNTAASSTGAVAWTLTYVPLDDGAAVTAA